MATGMGRQAKYQMPSRTGKAVQTSEVTHGTGRKSVGKGAPPHASTEKSRETNRQRRPSSPKDGTK